MSYDPRNINQMYEQYGRTHGGSSNKGSTYDETPQTITRGLGTPLNRSFSTRDDDDDKKDDVGGVKSFLSDVFSLFGMSGAEPKEPPSFEGSSVYERKEFKPITYDPTENRITVTGYNPNTAMRSSDEIMGDVDTMLDRSQDAGYISRPGIYDEVKEQDRPPTTIEDAINTAIENTMPTAGYKVKKGDTLSEIAQATGRTVKELQQLNDITDPRKMQAGSTLKIPVQTAQDIEVVEGARSMSELSPLRTANQSMMTGSQREYAPETGFEGMGPDPSTGQGIMSPPSYSDNSPNTPDTEFVQDAITQILSNEGGYNNNPSDRGNIVKEDGTVVGTMRGITPQTYADYVGKNVNDVTAEEMQAITEDTAREIYEDEYWSKPKIQLLPEELQENVFDMGVNSGRNAVKILQSLAGMTGADVDGLIGPDTIRAIEDADISNNDYVDARITYYRNLAQNNPDQRQFLNGWINRAEEYRD